MRKHKTITITASS